MFEALAFQKLQWGNGVTASQILAGGSTFGGESSEAGKANPYGTRASQSAMDMAAMMNGKFQVKKDGDSMGEF
eukprot:CAMPEP_0173436136 /NCGR_PEP_ID=MMETSP1357-20121228/15781_1 /TAXON_ID=77926 /ORGANISM="Hemiselmis rufescens, Strain PCC563" /LENGTH=72 /DNA_ID=CAMNT_0014401193 /DNA_START=11 /DNA_END=229 /DNA_ORIENTATION=+